MSGRRTNGHGGRAGGGRATSVAAQWALIGALCALAGATAEPPQGTVCDPPDNGNPSAALPQMPAPVPPEEGDPCELVWTVNGYVVSAPGQDLGPEGHEYAWPGINTDRYSTCWFNMVYPGVGGGVGGQFFHGEHGGHPQVPEGCSLCSSPQQFEVPNGFRSPMSLLAAPSIGDWLSASPTLGGDTLALLPRGMEGASTGWNGISRPTLEGVVDLITGSPLAQFTDLELPFGSATFRLTRTRSAAPALSENISATAYTDDNMWQLNAADRWWDWAGLGWMMSENPVLLIDSALPDVVGPNPRTAWLVLDAHRSIPFQMVQLAVGQGEEPRVAYEAPPRFRAKMTHDGEWGTLPTYFNQPGNPTPPPLRYGWTERPTQYTVSLYDGAVKYTFAAVYDDVPPHAYDRNLLLRDPNNACLTPPIYEASTLHDLPLYDHEPNQPVSEVGLNPLWPGWGVPHYGLCVQMEDATGNTAKIHYCGVTRKTVVDLPADTENPARQQTDCHECQQLCFRKGQISRVELFSAEEMAAAQPEPTWTLLYAHREFKGDPPHKPYTGESGAWDPDPASLHPALWGMSAVDTIYAFAGDPFEGGTWTGEQDDLCLYVPVGTPLHDVDPLAWEPLTDCETPDDLPLPTDWVYRVRYHYDAKPEAELPAQDVPVLLGTTVSTRERQVDEVAGGGSALGAGIEGTEREREMALRYLVTDSVNGHRDGLAPLPVLTALYSHEDMERLRARIGSTTGWPALWKSFTASEFRLAHQPSDPTRMTLSQLSVVSDEDQRAVVASFASVCWQQQEQEVGRAVGAVQDMWPTGANSAKPPADSICDAEIGEGRAFVSTSVPKERWMNDGSNAATRALSVQRGDGTTGHYLIHRLLVLPRLAALSRPNDDEDEPFWRKVGGAWDSDIDDLLQPMRSMFVQPYRWKTYGDDTLDDSPNLEDPRYIAIVDEFASREEMMDDTALYETTSSLKPGQTARRVVEINAAGYVLRDRRWDFSKVDEEGNCAFSSTGIGAEYVYKPLGTVLPAAAAELELLVTPSDPDSGPNGDQAAQIEAFTGQLLLTQVRTVGWSLADVDTTIDERTNGLIYFYEHQWLPDPQGTEEAPDRLPWGARAVVKAEGVQQGSGTQSEPASRLYTRQWFRAGDDEIDAGASPTDIIAEVQFLNAAGAGTLMAALPAIGSQSDGVSIQRFVTKRYDDGDLADRPPNERPVELSVQIGPGRKVLPDSADYYPFTATYFEPVTGYQTWSSMGMLPAENPIFGTGASFNTADPFSTLVITRLYVDPEGRATLTVADFDPEGSGDFDCPSYIRNGYPEIARSQGTAPSPEWVRLPAAAPAHTAPVEAKTFYGYDGYGLSDIAMPNGRRWARRHVWISRPPYEDHNPDFGTTYPTREEDYRYAPANGVGSWAVMPEDNSSDIHFGGGQFCREFVFPDLQLQGTEWRAVSAGEVRDYIGDQPTGELAANRRVEFPQDINGTPADVTIFLDPTPGATPGGPDSRGPHTQPWFRELARQKMYPDQFGRMERAETMVADLSGVLMELGSKIVNDLGEVYREREIDGTITRITRNALGHALRRYVGTRDDEWTTENGAPGLVPQTETNNLMLVERTEYGDTPNDVWLPTISRRYDTNQGFANDWHEYPWQEPPAADPHGQATVTSYDWRRRPVRTDVYSKGVLGSTATRLSTTLTFLDHAGRVVMEVQYGADDGTTQLSVPATHDPSKYTIADVAIPPPASFLGASLAGIAPISITFNQMGPDGNVVERHDYLMDSTTAAAAFHASLTYTGVGGQPLYQQSPGQAAQHTILDGLGRTASVRTILPPSELDGTEIAAAPELARTDSEYDADGNVIRTTTWQRIVPWSGSGQTTLDATNAISSTTINWYDQQRRLIATVDLGATDGETDPTAGGLDSANAWSGVAGPWHVGGSAIPWFDPSSPPHLVVSSTGPDVERVGVPPYFPLAIYHYNLAGHQEYVVRQTLAGDGSSQHLDLSHYSITRTLHDGLGNPVHVIENFGGEDDQQRETLNGYVFNRLDSVRQLSTLTTATGSVPAALANAEPMFNLDFGASAANDWGAEVVDAGDGTLASAVTSRHGGHVKFMHLPPEYVDTDPNGNPVPAINDFRGLKFRYDFQGRIVERIDARGISMRYEYDALDRLSKVRVGSYPVEFGPTRAFPYASWTPGYPAQGGSAPTDRVARLEYTYAPDMKTYEVKAFDASGTRTTHTKLEFNVQGNLIKDWQALGSNINAGTPRTEYTWDVVPTDLDGPTGNTPGHTRLSTLRYPKAPNVPTRYVEFTYGASGSPTDATSTVALMRSRYGTEPYRPAAAFGHFAESRRAWMTLGDDLLTQSYGLDTTSGGTPAGVGLAGLDGLGRLRSLTYHAGPHDAPASNLLAFNYTYDLAGQRLSAERTPRPAGGLDADSIETQKNEYDALMRLKTSDLEHLDDANDPTPLPFQSSEWTLDAWGTWANRLTLAPTPDENDDPTNVDAWSLAHVADPRAAISSITRTLDEYPGGDPQQLAVIPPDHDAAGNIVYDGTYIYQYDAWSRLVQVNLAAQPPPGGGPATGDAVPGTQQLAGPLVKHFTYDGLGRLVRVLSPYPEPGATPPVGWTTAPVRSERLYYDGVRRIQEVYTDPLLALGESAAQGSGSAQGEIGQGAEEEGQTLEGEEGQIGEGEGEPGGEEPPGPPPNTFITYLEREYLWGSGDGITGGAGAGLDELIAIFDIDRRAWWTLLDASGDVVAIVDDSAATTHGFGTGSASTSSARLCAQFCYDPYGSLLSVQGLHAFPDPRTGHKGLHLDRLDAGVADPLTGAPIARHVDPSTLPGGGAWAAAGGLTHRYFVRNRHYAPDLGRFMQRDPNGTGQLVLGAHAEARGQLQGMVGTPMLMAHLVDGVGVQSAMRSEPLSGADPFGLFEFSLSGLMSSATTTGELQSQWNDTVLDAGMSAFGTVLGEFGTHGANGVMDATWALDWSAEDDAYSSGVMIDRHSPRGPPTFADAIWWAKTTTLDKMLGTGNFNKGPGRKGVRGVYVVFTKEGEPVYAGLTKNLHDRPEKQKWRGGKGAFVRTFPVPGPGAKLAVRALEDILIRENNLIDRSDPKRNQQNGISDRNKKRAKYYTALQLLAQSLGL